MIYDGPIRILMFIDMVIAMMMVMVMAISI